MENLREKTEMRLPEPFREAMKELLGGEYGTYLDSFAREPSVGIRINRQKISVPEFLERSPFALRPIPWTENGFYAEHGAPVSRHPWYAAGLYYIQEPSAMLPAARLPVEPGDRVLDLCAAPGGKATELGSRLEGQGLLVANDISASRSRGLLKNLERFGIGNLFVCSEDPERLTPRYNEYFDKILVDAPCSGEGMFRRDPSMIKSWLQRGPSFYCGIQKRLLGLAYAMLRPGGMLLYSTCTFSVMENEDVIRAFLEEYSDMELCSMPVCEGFAKGICRENDSHPELERCVRLFPHRIEGEGHFAALLKKRKTGTVGSASALDSVVTETAEVSDKRLERESLPKRKRKRNRPESGKEGEIPENRAAEGESETAWREFMEHIWKPLSGRDERQSNLFDESDDASESAGNSNPIIRIVKIGDYLHALPEASPIPLGLRFLRTGLLLGAFQKNRFTPSQALAMALNPNELRQALCLSAEDSRVSRYLRGETLELTDEECSGLENGWVLVCVDHFGLGWGKLVGETLRNKYEPGWRRDA